MRMTTVRDKEMKPAKTTAKRLVILMLAASMVLLGACSSGNSQNDSAVGNSAANSNSAADPNTSNTSTADESSNHASDDSGDKSTAEEPAADDGSAAPDSDEGGNSQYDASKPGQLTAGEWDDLAAHSRWAKLLSGSYGQDNTAYWSIFPQRQLEVIVKADGRAVSDAVVSVMDEDGQSIWEGRTNNNGVAFVYAGLFDEQDTQEQYGIEVTSGNETKRYENVPIPRGQALNVNLDAPVKASKALDLMLVVDTTGSMGDELNYLKTELKDVVERVGKDNGQQLDIRVSTNFYRDRGDEYVVKDFPFTADIDKAVGQLSEQSAAGGGDFPEAVDEALDNAINDHKWSDTARARLMFLVLDAPPHHERKVGKRLHELMETAAAEGIRIIPVASSGVDVHTEYLMRFLASSTGGTYLFLTDHSGIGNSHEKPAVGEYEVKALNDLLVDVINRYSS
ncbi:VWA domain-containing protein [Paenibacillus sp. R14(2021)]|uniref:VWA domain-containing protein n=1 Tax=Paenibacillus sp. R14(2021) TaxID=2859228 RepID=UPI001C614AFC|nr:VWA domain-containing protein [Paenibacillus sp. R14(2021)]